MLLFSRISLQILFAVTLCGNVESKSFKFTNVKCISFNETFAIFKTCRLKAVRRDVTELSIYVKLLQIPINNVQFSLIMKKRSDYLNQSLYEYKIDGCAFLRNNRRNPFANIFYSALGLKTHSNVNHTCPYNHDLILDRYAINNNWAALLPLPIGSYLIYTHWETDGVARGEVNLVIETIDRK